MKQLSGTHRRLSIVVGLSGVTCVSASSDSDGHGVVSYGDGDAHTHVHEPGVSGNGEDD